MKALFIIVVFSITSTAYAEKVTKLKEVSYRCSTKIAGTEIVLSHRLKKIWLAKRGEPKGQEMNVVTYFEVGEIGEWEMSAELDGMDFRINFYPAMLVVREHIIATVTEHWSGGSGFRTEIHSICN